MGEDRLRDLTEVRDKAYKDFYEAQETIRAIDERLEDLKRERSRAVMAVELDRFMSGQGKTASCDEEKENEKKAAVQALEEALAAKEKAEADMQAAASIAQAAEAAVEKKKQELRDDREKDAVYVVHRAQIECPYGMRESYLALEYTHGVLTRKTPQMTVKDILLNKNIINFGGCYSKENPMVQEAIERVTAAANEQIDEMKDWRDDVIGFAKKVTGFFMSPFIPKNAPDRQKTEEELAQERMSECVGECIAEFPADAEWIEGQEKVLINGEPVLLRKCSIMCNYKGCITILDPGQPE